MLRVLQLLIMVPISTFLSLLAIRPMTVWEIWGFALGLVCLLTGVMILTQKPFALQLVGFGLAMEVIYAVSHACSAGIDNSPNLRAVAERSFVTVMECLVWFLYFRLSVRVRNTFGRNL